MTEKYVKIVHENVKWFCHYYNNDKECPRGEKCIFLHEHSGDCRYKNLCERNNCMFKHEAGKSEQKGSEAANENGIWEVNEEECLEVSECIDDVSENMENFFCKPSQNKEGDLTLGTDGQYFYCNICEYKATTKHDLKNHEDEKHNWCWVCERNFETKKEFKIHHYTVHSASKGIWD